MVSIDSLVKKLILNHFRIFPSRMHVLRHLFLVNGTGFDWVVGDDGKAYLSNFSDPTGDEEMTMYNTADFYQPDGFANSVEMENLIREFVANNIDAYSSPDFFYVGVDLRPDTFTGHFSRKYNCLASAPDNIAEDWRAAILEVADYFMPKISEGFFPSDDETALDYVRRKNPAQVDLYLALMHARERFGKTKTKSIASMAQAARTVNRMQSNYQTFALKDVFSFKEYIKATNLLLDHPRQWSGRIEDAVDAYLTCLNDRFDREGNPTAALTEAVKEALHHQVDCREISVPDLTRQVCRVLRINRLLQPKVKSLVNEMVIEAYPAS